MRKIRTFLLTLCVAGVLCGCGKTAEEANVQGESVAVEGDDKAVADAVGNAVEDVAVSQDAENDEAEEEEEESSEIEAWFEAQGFTEPTVVIWDTESGMGIVVERTEENIKEYEYGEEDKLLLYYAGPIDESYLSSPLTIGEMYITYAELYAEFDIALDCIVENVVGGKSYKQKFTLRRPKSNAEAATEKTQSEEDASHLSNEEWVESLNIQEPTFMIFNEITGEKKVLENGQEYKFEDGDELAYKGPFGWGAFTYAIDVMNNLYDTEIKYNCVVYSITLDAINEEGMEFRQYVEDLEGENRRDFIFYLSK